MSSVLLTETKEEKVEKLTIYNVSHIIGWQIKCIMSLKISSHRLKFLLSYALALQRKKIKCHFIHVCICFWLLIGKIANRTVQLLRAWNEKPGSALTLYNSTANDL